MPPPQTHLVEMVEGRDELPLMDIARVTAKAFATDMLVWENVFPDNATREGLLAYLFERTILMDVVWDNATYYVVRETSTNEVVACASAALLEDVNGSAAEGTLASIWGGLLKLPFIWSWDTIRRLMYFGDESSKRHKDDVSQELGGKASSAHWYVRKVVVHPKCQGQGIGSLMMNKLKETCKATRDVPIYFGTNKEANVTFYSKLGFRQISHNMYGDTGAPHFGMFMD